MASWTDISDAVLAIDQPVRSIDHLALRENITAAFEKAAGAPVLADGYIVEAMLGTGIVSATRLKTSVQTVAGSTGSGYVALSGGSYCFLPTGQQAQGSSAAWVGWAVTASYQNSGSGWSGTAGYNINGGLPYIGGTEVALIQWAANSSNSPIHVRYVQASPPYDLGDGDIPLFVFARVARDGRIICITTAEDPPWAANGPTETRPEVLFKGRHFRFKRPNFKKARDMDERRALLREHRAFSAMRDRLERSRGKERQLLLRSIHQGGLLEPIDQERKQRDMPLIPHPFSLEEGDTVVMLGLHDDLHELAELDRHGESAALLMLNDYYRIDNVPAARKAPPGVMPVLGRWK